MTRLLQPCRTLSRLLFAMAIVAFSAITSEAAKITFSGNSLKAVEVDPEKNTGLDKIFVLYGTEGVSATFTDASASGSNVHWYRYSNLGGGYAEEIAGISYSGTSSTLPQVEGDMGYIVEYGTKRYYFWVVNYLPHRLSLKGVAPSADQTCDGTTLELTFEGTPIHYFSINGQQRTLDQEITVEYYNLEWDGDNKQYIQVEADKHIESPASIISLYPPVLCQTTFVVTGDRFLKSWNWGESVESEMFNPVAVQAHTEAVQAGVESRVRAGRSGETDDTTSDEEPSDAEEDTEEEEDDYRSNQMKTDHDGLGGSAPCDITFYAYTTDAVIHHEWQMSSDPEFNDIAYRFNEQDLSYTFVEEGTTYLRYIGSNADGSCETVGETYEVVIGASDIWCPNAFSPGASEGVNDIWKVSYRSLLTFKCWIFDRYGTQLFYFDNPEDGWDGKYRGKPVRPGVYYYVIEATGADGKKYKKSGDINIIRYRVGETSTAPGDITE